MTKEQMLKYVMIEAYWQDKWLSMEKIIELTRMGSYNQRFQEWRKLGISVANRIVGNQSFYKLDTNPDTIDWDRMAAKIPENRIARTGKKQETVKEQEKLAL